MIMQVGKLLQEGGFGDSSDEDADEDDADERRLRPKVTPAAKSQSSDAPAAPPTPEPLAPQARAFMEEKGLDTWETDETTVILECCTEASQRRLHYDMSIHLSDSAISHTLSKVIVVNI